MNNFEFENRTKVYFGKGVVAEKLPVLAARYGGKVLLGYGGGSIKKNGVYDEVTGILKDAGVEIVEFSGIMSNPTLEKMQEGARLAKEQGVTWILAVGGGSVMDCCKSISIAVPYDGDVWEEFWEKPGNLNFDPLPLGMIVTMPATGSEVNGSAVLTNTEKHIKTDRDYPRMNADFALMDPTYTYSMPLRQLRAGTFDILSHIMETYFSFPIEDNVSDDISDEGRHSGFPQSPSESGGLRCAKQHHVGSFHGGKPGNQDGKNQGFRGAQYGAPAECLHGLQPRRGTCGAAPDVLPPYFPGRPGQIHPFRNERMGPESGGLCG